MAWVPSIGACDIATLDSKLFPIWEDNLLVGSLASRSLYRLVVVDDRVVVQEPIALNKRVRDILPMPDGRIMIWSDDWALTLLEPATSAIARAYSRLSVWDITPWWMACIASGPDLFRGRRSAGRRCDGVDEYSAAMKAQEGQWDAAALDKFLAQPAAAVPGTSMAFPGWRIRSIGKRLSEYRVARGRDKADGEHGCPGVGQSLS